MRAADPFEAVKGAFRGVLRRGFAGGNFGHMGGFGGARVGGFGGGHMGGFGGGIHVR